MIQNKGLVIGIDATNLRRGGGRTHLIELLRSLQPEYCSVAKVIVFGSVATLASLDDQPWLDKINPPALDGNLIKRILWQRFSLSRAARTSNCDLLFIPGGSYSCNFCPVVTMCRNMLPFDWRELFRYGWTFTTLKLCLLRLIQSRSFNSSQGVIFLTKYARNLVTQVTGVLKAQQTIIPHGFNSRFSNSPKKQLSITQYNEANPYRIIYVSIIDHYKHQWHVVEAAAYLRQRGFPIVLDLIGPDYPSALLKLKHAIQQHDPNGNWVNYRGSIPFNDLHHYYANADLGLFASSCENMPNILLETMASGLPIACSNKGPMPEILGDAGVYFDPEQPQEIAGAVLQLIQSPQFRTELAGKSFQRVRQYSWKRCASDTFNFLADIANSQSR